MQKYLQNENRHHGQKKKMDEILERFGSSIKAWYAGHYHINEERNMSENWKGEVKIFYDCFWKE